MIKPDQSSSYNFPSVVQILQVTSISSMMTCETSEEMQDQKKAAAGDMRGQQSHNPQSFHPYRRLPDSQGEQGKRAGSPRSVLQPEFQQQVALRGFFFRDGAKACEKPAPRSTLSHVHPHGGLGRTKTVQPPLSPARAREKVATRPEYRKRGACNYEAEPSNNYGRCSSEAI